MHIKFLSLTGDMAAVGSGCPKQFTWHVPALRTEQGGKITQSPDIVAYPGYFSAMWFPTASPSCSHADHVSEGSVRAGVSGQDRSCSHSHQDAAQFVLDLVY